MQSLQPEITDDSDDYTRALALVKDARRPSVSLVQRRMGIGWNYANQLVNRMIEAGEVEAPAQVTEVAHQSQLPPKDNKFHVGNGDDGKHYWLTPPALYEQLNLEFNFDFDPCPFPKPEGFDGLTCEWGQSSYVNPPFGSIVHEGKKKGPTAWARKAIAEQKKGKRVVLVYPMDKWVLMLLDAGAKVRNLGDVRWHATEDGSQGKGTGRHIACFVLDPKEAA